MRPLHAVDTSTLNHKGARGRRIEMTPRSRRNRGTVRPADAAAIGHQSWQLELGQIADFTHYRDDLGNVDTAGLLLAYDQESFADDGGKAEVVYLNSLPAE